MKILLFTGLKMVEAMGIAGILYWFYWCGKAWIIYWEASDPSSWPVYILIGLWIHLMVVLACAMSSGIVAGLYQLWVKNWEWTNRILNK